MTQLETPRNKLARFTLEESVSDVGGIKGEMHDDVVDLGLIEDGKINFIDRLRNENVGVLSLNGTKTNVRVLDEGSEIAFKRGTSLDVKVIIVNPTSRLADNSIRASVGKLTSYQPCLGS